MKQCTYCGTEMSGDFCPNCGKKFEEIPNINPVHCPKCGKIIWDTTYNRKRYDPLPPKPTTYCEKCGYKLEGNVYKIVDGLKIVNDVLFEVVDKNIETIVIPNNIKYIGYHAFKQCRKLKTIYIHHVLVGIDAGAFDYCGGEMIEYWGYYGKSYRYQPLTIICYQMTKAQWHNLCRDGYDGWWYNGHSCTVMCSDGHLDYKNSDD